MADADVVVVGGGLAGLAATAVLADRGLRVTLAEARPRPGGRAGSFVDQTTGELVDNCQHVSMGCCTQFDAFCRFVGIDHLLEDQRELFFIGPSGTIHRFASSPLPAPMHLAPALMRLDYLTFREKRTIGRALLRLLRLSRPDAEGRSFVDWLEEQKQSDNAIARFWHVVLVSALSESLDRIDLWYARKVFVDGFLVRRDAWTVRIPVVPLDRLYGVELKAWLADRNVDVRLNCRVGQLRLDSDRIAGVTLRDDGAVVADRVIVAVPQFAAGAVVPADLHARSGLDRASAIETAPISSVHLWFDQPIVELPHAVFVDRFSQWMFNRTAVGRGESISTVESDSGQYLQIVISASRELSGMSQPDIVKRVVGDLSAVWPDAARAEIRHARIITEHRAVFSAVPGIDDLRPPQRTEVPGLYLAGDWTQTGWPATMEGAVRSGYHAARCLLGDIGDGGDVPIEDEPSPGTLLRWISGLA